MTNRDVRGYVPSAFIALFSCTIVHEPLYLSIVETDVPARSSDL